MTDSWKWLEKIRVNALGGSAGYTRDELLDIIEVLDADVLKLHACIRVMREALEQIGPDATYVCGENQSIDPRFRDKTEKLIARETLTHCAKGEFE